MASCLGNPAARQQALESSAGEEAARAYRQPGNFIFPGAHSISNELKEGTA